MKLQRAIVKFVEIQGQLWQQAVGVSEILGLLGFTLGMVKHKNLVPSLLAIILIVIIIGVIIDLDRPRRGLIQVSQESMIQLQQIIK